VLFAARSARIAAIASIASAVVALGGTIGSGFIAADSASDTVAVQANRETERSRAEFLRAQRQELYAKALIDHQALSDAQGKYWSSVARAKKSELTSDADPTRPAFKRAAEDYGIIQFVGSSGAGDAYYELLMAHVKRGDIIREARSRKLGGRIPLRSLVKVYAAG